MLSALAYVFLVDQSAEVNNQHNSPKFVEAMEITPYRIFPQLLDIYCARSFLSLSLLSLLVARAFANYLVLTSSCRDIPTHC
jgi:hypothetical protein